MYHESLSRHTKLLMDGVSMLLILWATTSKSFVELYYFERGCSILSGNRVCLLQGRLKGSKGVEKE